MSRTRPHSSSLKPMPLDVPPQAWYINCKGPRIGIKRQTIHQAPRGELKATIIEYNGGGFFRHDLGVILIAIMFGGTICFVQRCEMGGY